MPIQGRRIGRGQRRAARYAHTRRETQPRGPHTRRTAQTTALVTGETAWAAWLTLAPSAGAAFVAGAPHKATPKATRTPNISFFIVTLPRRLTPLGSPLARTERIVTMVEVNGAKPTALGQ